MSTYLLTVSLCHDILQETVGDAVTMDSADEADTGMPTVQNLHFSVASNSTGDAME